MESNEPEGVSSREASQDALLGSKASSLDPDSLSLARCESLLDELTKEVGKGKEASSKHTKGEQEEVTKGEKEQVKDVGEKEVDKEESNIKVIGDEKQEKIVKEKKLEEAVGGKNEDEAVGEKNEEKAVGEGSGNKDVLNKAKEETIGGKLQTEDAGVGDENMEDEVIGEANDGEDEAVEEKSEEPKQSRKDKAGSKPGTPRHLFHLSDNMKKGLSMLAYPSKAPTRKKGITSSRSTSNFRITIGEVLEKVQDVEEKKSSESANVSAQSQEQNSSRSEPASIPTPVEGQSGDVDSDKGESKVGRVSIVDLSTLVGEKEPVLKCESVPSENMSTESSSNDSLATTSSEGRKMFILFGLFVA